MKIRAIATAGAIIALAMVPWTAGEYWTFVMTEILILALFAVSFNLLLGYGGMLSLGHAAPFGLGAYTVALLVLRAGVTSIPGTLLAGAAVSALAGLVIGYFCVRASRVFFTMLTLAFAQMFYALASRWYAVTGGDTGLPGLPAGVFFGTPVASRMGNYYVVLVCVLLSLWVLWRVTRSPFGLILTAIRDNPKRVRYLGVSVARHQLVAFVVAWIFAGLAGGLWAWNQRAAFPDTLEWGRSAEVLAMAILGGHTTFWGPIAGAAIYTLLLTLFTRSFEYWSLVLGLIVITVALAFPNGITGLLDKHRTSRAVGGEGDAPHLTSHRAS
ncbi:MAG TPA: branched-chain amino acid ABC transporter permease [Calditerricola sp.]